MQKIFLDFTPSETFALDEELSRHLAKSLRMRVGDMVMATDGSGQDFGCIIKEINKENVVLEVCYQQANNSEPSVKVKLYQGVPKGDKMEDIIQKCTEVGISEITPVLTKRSISRPDEKQANKKNVRYNKIALEAAQQSGRGIIPEIKKMSSFKEAVKNDEADLKILFYEGGGEPLNAIVNSDVKSVSIYIGPEGGFDPDEVELLKENGAKIATLGPRILRTQTAPVVALTAIMMLTNNLK